jgi:excisionase family DNA binding protein
MDWLTIPQMAKKIDKDASSNLVRRYIKRFPFFFVGQLHDGIMHYPPDTMDILKRIYNLYRRKKKNRKEIEEILYQEYGNTTTIIQPEKPDIERLSIKGGDTSLPAIMPEITRLADAFERIATALEKQTGTGSQPAVIENQSIQDKEILTDKETAFYLGLADRTLRDWRKKGKGPAFVRMGTKIRYRKTAINEYLDIFTVPPGEQQKSN